MLTLADKVGGVQKDAVLIHVWFLKVAFIQKGLVNLSFLQTDVPNYFPELKFRFFFILNGSNHVK